MGEKGVDAMDLALMNTECWKEIPEDLVVTILTRMPWQSVLRFRSVCRLWNCVLSNSRCFESGTQFEGGFSEPFCFIATQTGIVIYSPVSKHWRSISYQALIPSSVVGESNVFVTVAAAVGGLFLLECVDKSRSLRTLVLCNPLNKSCRKLPLPNGLAIVGMSGSGILGMFMDFETSSHKILVQGSSYELGVDRKKNSLFYLYDTKYNAWHQLSMRGSPPASANKVIFSSPAYHQGSLYLLASDRVSTPEGIVRRVYKVGEDGWKEIPATVPFPMEFAHIFVLRSRVLLAGGMKGSEKRLKSVHSWRLDENQANWTKVHNMPDEPLEVLSRGAGFYCATDGDSISFSNSMTEWYTLSTGKKAVSDITTIVYSFSKDLWHTVPVYDGKNHCRRSLYSPKLEISV